MTSNKHFQAKSAFALILLFFSNLPCFALPEHADPASGGFAGSGKCIQCHEKFYELWSTSFHGLAMQPYTDIFAQASLTGQNDFLNVTGREYRTVIDPGAGYVIERIDGKETRYKIAHVLGGKNIYYFLTMLDKGRLQVLPLAYDVNRKEWFDTTASAVRHFDHVTDQAIDWKESPLTFNTSCFSCHVSQLSTNYDFKSDTYHTVWAEPGINCETCHGPAGEHVRMFQQAAKTNTVPEELGLISTNTFDTEQTNTMCAPCHAKMRPITSDFQPGDRYCDHFDLVTLEDPDFYPDGRDLGENYTYTGWRMNPCAKSGKLDCIHCHTSSGRNRFKGEKANNACLPCHEKRVNNIQAHTRHDPKGKAGKCISCHMPKTEFARMIRHDHSFRPPMPKAAIAFKSPNACNICHDDKDAEWADQWATKWFGDTYQNQTLKKASLIDQARKSDWKNLKQMLDYIISPQRDEIFAVSLVRLLQNCPDNSKWNAIRKTLKDPSPLVRSAAAAALAADYSPETQKALMETAGDKWRLPRIQAAFALSGFPVDNMDKKQFEIVEKASKEYEASLQTRQDDSNAHYNLGNYYFNRGRFEKSLESYSSAYKLGPDNFMPLVNSSIVYARMGKTRQSQDALEKALKIAPENSEINFNMGLLLAEKGQLKEAQKHLRRALKSDPDFAEAAFNLGVMLANSDISEAVRLCRRAYRLRPENTRYGYTLAYYLNQSGDRSGAVAVLTKMVNRPLTPASVYGLLAAIHMEMSRKGDAMEIYRKAIKDESLTVQERYNFQAILQSLQQK